MTEPRVSTEELVRLRREGLTDRDIAASVHMSRQGVAYRLKNSREQDERRAVYPRQQTASTMTRWDWHPRVPEETPLTCPVADCQRIVGRANRAKGKASILPEPECCRYCARPLTPEAIARAPRDGFVAFMAAFERRRPTGPTPDWFGEGS
jgi:hypothetical protein